MLKTSIYYFFQKHRSPLETCMLIWLKLGEGGVTRTVMDSD